MRMRGRLDDPLTTFAHYAHIGAEPPGYLLSLSSATSRLAQVCWVQMPLALIRLIFWNRTHAFFVSDPKPPSTSTRLPRTMLRLRCSASTTSFSGEFGWIVGKLGNRLTATANGSGRAA